MCHINVIITNLLYQAISVEKLIDFASKEVSCILSNLNVISCVHESWPAVPILSQMNPAHALHFFLFKIYSNIVILSTANSLSGVLFPSGFHYQNPVYLSFLLHACNMPFQCHPPWSDHEAPHYASFSSLLFIPPSQTRKFLVTVVSNVFL